MSVMEITHVGWLVITNDFSCFETKLEMLEDRIVRVHIRNFWLCKAFFSRIWHAVVLTQFGNADSKSAPCQAIFCVFPTQNAKTKWPPKLVKMSQLYMTAWLTMNIKHYFGVLKPTWATYLKSPKFHLVRLPLEDKIQNGRHFKAMCHNFASK